MKKYRIAIYLRLSKEDDRLRQESNSISMQRILLEKYVEESFPDFELVEFSDEQKYDRVKLYQEGGYAALSKHMIDRYIKQIVIYDEQNIEIEWMPVNEEAAVI